MFKSTSSRSGIVSVPKQLPKHSFGRHNKTFQRLYSGQAVMAASEESIASKGIAGRKNWDLWRNRLQGQSPNGWVVYGGAWKIWDSDVTDAPRELVGMRCFKPEGEDASGFVHVNVLSETLVVEAPPVLRPDGWLYTEYHRSISQPNFSGSSELADEEKLPGGASTGRASRFLAVTGEAYAIVMLELPSAATGDPAPPQMLTGQGDSAPAAPPNIWSSEVFLHDGECRWSMGAVWDGLSGALLKQFLIREYERPGVDPSDTLPPAQEVKMPEARPALGDDEAVRQMQGSKRGRLLRTTFHHGSVSSDVEQSDVEPPPLHDDTSYRMIRYPDQMFAHMPATLPKAKQSGDASWRFTWGGAMKGNQFGYQQLQATYCGTTGRLLEMTSFTS